MRFLFDTSIIVPAEPTGLADVEATTPLIAQLMQLLTRGGHQIHIHERCVRELEGDRDEKRRAMRLLLLSKYQVLVMTPAIPAALEAAIGKAARGSHDEGDHLLLAALQADAVDYLVTEDRDLRRKAKLVGLAARVLNVVDAIATLRALFDDAPTAPPAVRQIPAYALDETDPIFDSLRSDYPGFDDWLKKCKREHRQCWIIQPSGDTYAGICIINPENARQEGQGLKSLKICTLKISSNHLGNRFGELLLKAVFQYCVLNSYDMIYLTAFAKHVALLSLLDDFGFVRGSEPLNTGEYRYTKRLRWDRRDQEELDPLSFHIMFGPPTVKWDDAKVFVVPIRPTYHRILFPDAEVQPTLFAGQFPSGNAIRKAYLCHSSVRGIEPGTILLFYRTQEQRGIFCLGVAEETMVSNSANDVARFVGKRTVYGYQEIEALCRKEVLAISFRHARVLQDRIALAELIARGAIRGTPQSITACQTASFPWLELRTRGL